MANRFIAHVRIFGESPEKPELIQDAMEKAINMVFDDNVIAHTEVLLLTEVDFEPLPSSMLH